MITGAHAIIYSTKPEVDRAFLRDVLQFPHVDVGEGWLIFALPPAEVAVHPSKTNGVHELYLMCDDIARVIQEMTRHGIACSPAKDQGWGVLAMITLPGGGQLGIYQPRHARPPQLNASAPLRRTRRRPR